MTRTAPSGTSKSPVTVCYLMELVFLDGAAEVIVRLTTAAEPVTTDADGDGSAETYDAAGQLLEWGGESETSDRRGQGTRIQLGGVDQSIIADLMAYEFRGQRVRIWRAEGDPSTGTWSTWLVHRGLQLDDYEIREDVPDDPNNPTTAVIETRSVSRMAALQATNAVKTNERSHNAMLSRAGVATGDTGMFYTKQLPGRVFWGSEAPDPALSGENAGGSAGTSGGSGGGGGTSGGGRSGRTRLL
jgi:hypothetical protein